MQPSLGQGQKIIAEVWDVGPWNGGGEKGQPKKYDDNYWKKHRKQPQSESGTDKRGRKTNKAGIDLSNKVFDDLGLKDNDIVKWRFVK